MREKVDQEKAGEKLAQRKEEQEDLQERVNTAEAAYFNELQKRYEALVEEMNSKLFDPKFPSREFVEELDDVRTKMLEFNVKYAENPFYHFPESHIVH